MSRVVEAEKDRAGKAEGEAFSNAAIGAQTGRVCGRTATERIGGRTNRRKNCRGILAVTVDEYSVCRCKNSQSRSKVDLR